MWFACWKQVADLRRVLETEDRTAGGARAKFGAAFNRVPGVRPPDAQQVVDHTDVALSFSVQRGQIYVAV